MQKDPYYRINQEPDALQGFSRTVAEIEWLLLVLVLFYLVVGHVEETVRALLLLGLCGFAAFVMAFHYVNFFAKVSPWKLAVETWVMICFITWAVWHTGQQASPLLNLYFLPVITSALTLGRVTTLLEVLLIGASYLYLGRDGLFLETFDLWRGGSALVTWLFPMLLVGYVTTMLANDIYLAFSRLKTDAQTDDLTGLYNQRAFVELLDRLLRHAQRHRQPMSLLMVDCDNLKQVNDKHGHEAGNLLLRSIAEGFRETLRGGDYAARYGGDEFAALLPDTPSDQALLVAERLRTGLSSASFCYRGETFVTSVSIGVACFPQHGRNADELLHAADNAMYVSKSEGRNRITSAG